MGRWLLCVAAGLCLLWLWPALGLGLGVGVGVRASSEAGSKATATGARTLRRARALSQEEELEQILGDGQPEDIGYGFQRARSTRPSYQGLLLFDRAGAGAGSGWQDTNSESPSTFRERLESKRDSDDDDVPVLASPFRERVTARQRRQRSRQHLERLIGGPASRRPDPPGADIVTELSESDLQALRELLARYQMQTGAIDLGPDDFTDLEALQMLEALESTGDRGAARKRSPRSSSTSWYSSSPLAWSGYQLRKRSVKPEFQSVDPYDETEGDWSDEVSDEEDADDADLANESALATRARLAMLISPQLFDERYNDPSVKRLLLAKRSLPHMMKRKKKSAPSSSQGKPPANDPTVQRDLAHIFGEPEPPRALPLASSDTTASPNAVNGTKSIGHDQHGAMNPIGMAHETDQLARGHQHKGTLDQTTVTPDPDPKHENAPPMVAAEGPKAHEQAVHGHGQADKLDEHVDEKVPTPTPTPAPIVVAAGGEVREEPRALELRQLLGPRTLRVSKKSVDWSQYFGIDRRRKKSTGPEDLESNQINDDWLLRETLRAYAKASRPSNINKRVAVKKEGAPPDALLLGSLSTGGGDDDYFGQVDPGRCGAVVRLTEDCRLVVGSNDALLPLCVLYEACKLCGGATSMCGTELARQGPAICGIGHGSAACLAGVEAIVDARRSRYASDTDTCARQPCLAHFFWASPAVAYFH